jgi:hypothetical protein
MKRIVVVLLALALAGVFANAALADPPPVTIGQTGSSALLCGPSAWGFNMGGAWAVPAGDWTLTTWSTFAGVAPAGSMSMMVFRPTGTPGAYTVVGESPVESLTAGVLNTFTLGSPVDVQGGDLLGFWENNAYCLTSSSNSYAFGDGSQPAVGATVTPVLPSEGDLGDLNISATLVMGGTTPPPTGPTGVIEVCKDAAPGSGLTGTYNFTVTGSGGFSATTSSVLGSCSAPMTVPAGQVTIQEQVAGSLYVTAITAVSNGTNEIQSGTSVTNGTAVVGVNAGDASAQTLVTFTNDVTTLEVCKAWDSTAPDPASAYGFTFSASGPPGTTSTPLTSASIPAGTDASPTCITVGQYRAGTDVTITETGYPGTKVDNITVNPSGNAVGGSLSLALGTVTVDLTGQTATGGDTVVTFYDDPATTGMLKICKIAGTDPGPPIGTSFTFNYGPSGVTPLTVVVPLNGCSQPATIPFGTVLNISEVIGPGNAVSNIAVVPTFLTVGGTLTTIPVVSAMNIPAGTVSVTIGENVVTEVDYTDVDPPTSTASGGGSGSAGTTSSGGSGGSSSTSTGSTPATSAASVVTAGLGAAFTPPVVTSTTKAKLTKALELSNLRKKLKALKLSAHKLDLKLKLTAKHSPKHRKLASQIANLKAREVKISSEIALLLK